MDSLPSLLDKDDINGPGKGKFPRTEKGYSIDYALYKISLYYSSESPSEKLKFIRDLDSMALQLGPSESQTLFNVVETIVKSI